MAEFTDAIALLKADHREVETLFENFSSASGTQRKRTIALNICNALKIHAILEEQIFYPAFRGKIDDNLLDEAFVEHDGAKVLINDIANGGPDDDFYSAKVTVLCENIEHHVKEEERPGEGVFAQCRDTDVDLVELRDQMLVLQQRLRDQAAGPGLPPAKLAVVRT